MLHQNILYFFVAGVLATALMDLGAFLGHRRGYLTKMNPALFGRWVLRTLTGRFDSKDIQSTSGKPYDAAVGYLTHYGIGIALALTVGYLLDFHPELSVEGALAVAAITCALPWFFMFPSLGLGWFGLRGEDGKKRFASSLIAHLNYGLGLYLALVALRSL